MLPTFAEDRYAKVERIAEIKRSQFVIVGTKQTDTVIKSNIIFSRTGIHAYLTELGTYQYMSNNKNMLQRKFYCWKKTYKESGKIAYIVSAQDEYINTYITK